MDIDTIDELPRPRWTDLTLLVAVKAVTLASKAAMEADAEHALGTLNAELRGLWPADVCDDKLDAWARRGVVRGAEAAWMGSAGVLSSYPPDLPATAAHRRIYMAAVAVGILLVNTIKAEKDEAKHG
ncbi:MAG TPA: hypothetical protein VFH61_17535 [Thermoleophilia bacterium]|nr:hypothetical protein [Thermoleophilia bacterium]